MKLFVSISNYIKIS